MAFTTQEIAFLTSHSEQVNSCAFGLTKKSALADAQLARDTFGANGRAALELANARATGKVPGAWLADSESVQQATPLPVVEYRAAKLAAAGVEFVHDVTCSIGTEGYGLVGRGIEYLGSDLDFQRLLMARHNVAGGHFAQADALAPVSARGVVVADPARRSGGRRITDPAQLLPPLPDLVSAHKGREMAIKCAPGLDFSEWEGLVSVVSVDGGVKEACLYTPGLGSGSREAVMIKSQDGVQTVDVLDDSAQSLPEAGDIGRFIIDPDGAVVRAGLVRHYGAREELWQLDERIAYLTGNRIPEGTTGFEFIESVPLKKLKSALASHGAGSVEILVRGVDVDPDQLRKKLKLKGSKQMGVVITRIGSTGQALVCGPRRGPEVG